MAGYLDHAKFALVILMFALIIYFSYFLSGAIGVPRTTNTYLLSDVKINADPYFVRMLVPGEMDATAWVIENTNTTDKFVADIWGAELIMGMTARVSTVGGDWANAADPIRYMDQTNTIYTTTDAQTAYDLAKLNNCSYVWVPDRETFSGYSWVYGDHGKFNDTDYFLPVYANPGVTIYKVL